jgi:hypothetical protein
MSGPTSDLRSVLVCADANIREVHMTALDHRTLMAVNYRWRCDTNHS